MCEVESLLCYRNKRLVTQLSYLGDVHCVIVHMDLVFSVTVGVQFGTDLQK